VTPGNFGAGTRTDLLFYRAIDNAGKFYTTDGNGRLTLLGDHPDWHPTWRAIIPGAFDTSGHTGLLFYDDTNGDGSFCGTDGAGNLTNLRTHTDWRRTWFKIIPGHFGVAEQEHLFFYDNIIGEGQFYTVIDGSLSSLGGSHDLDLTWTQIIPGAFLAGSLFTDLLLYSAATGRVEIWENAGNGSINSISIQYLPAKLSTMVPGTFFGGPRTDLFCYSAADRKASIYRNDGTGTLQFVQEWPDAMPRHAMIVPGNFGKAVTCSDLLVYL
jgi:hypothetical protein